MPFSAYFRKISSNLLIINTEDDVSISHIAYFGILWGNVWHHPGWRIMQYNALEEQIHTYQTRVIEGVHSTKSSQIFVILCESMVLYLHSTRPLVPAHESQLSITLTLFLTQSRYPSWYLWHKHCTWSEFLQKDKQLSCLTCWIYLRTCKNTFASSFHNAKTCCVLYVVNILPQHSQRYICWWLGAAKSQFRNNRCWPRSTGISRLKHQKG